MIISPNVFEEYKTKTTDQYYQLYLQYIARTGSKPVDMHCHVYPEKIAVKASAGIGSFYNLGMHYDGTPEKLLISGKEAHIAKHVISSVATKSEQVSSINRFLSGLMQQSSGNVAALGTLYPDCQNAMKDVEELLTLGLVGVKLHPDIQNFPIDGDLTRHLFDTVETLAGPEFPILIHTGDPRHDNANPSRMLPILQDYPKQVFIGAHFGGWGMWDTAWKSYLSYPCFYVDCSSSFYGLTPEQSKEIIRTIGADRVLFGTDYPIWPPKWELAYLFSLGLSDKEYDLILYQNACRLFRLSPD